MDNLQADIIAVNSISAIPKILEVICRITGMGFAAVARVTKERWIACSVRDEIEFGLKSGNELKIETTICHEILQSHTAVVIDDVTKDQIYCSHPTPTLYGFQSYISVPIILPDGEFFGTLCAIDPSPARLNTPEIINMFTLFVELILFHLEALERLKVSDNKLQEERKISIFREQFIAVLGHDLRNPLTAISLGASSLLKLTQNQQQSNYASLIKDSAFRMSELIDNIMDFAHGRLGGGIPLNCKANNTLEYSLKQVITELRIKWPTREIKEHYTIQGDIYCDSHRVAQALSNLLSNALNYGIPNQPILIRAITNEERFELSVSNVGNPISTTKIKHLFQPFYRGDVESNQTGLGLGLYIAAEIARAHKGSLDVISTSEKTCFTLRIPC